MLTYAICTHQQRTKIFKIPVQRIKRGKQEESWCFGLCVMGPTSLYCVTTEKCFFLQVCPCSVHTDLLYVRHVHEKCVWQRCGPCVYTWGTRGEGAPSGCNGGPWHLTGLQQCGGQAGTVNHFGYVHIRSRSMAPPDECHFLRSNTQTWRNRKETVGHHVTNPSHQRSCLGLLVLSEKYLWWRSWDSDVWVHLTTASLCFKSARAWWQRNMAICHSHPNVCTHSAERVQRHLQCWTNNWWQNALGIALTAETGDILIRHRKATWWLHTKH